MRKTSLLSMSMMLCLVVGSVACKKDDPPKTEDKKASAESKKTEDKKPDEPAKKGDDDDKGGKKEPKGKKKTVGDKLPADQTVQATPKEWMRFFDDVRLFEFYAPANSTMKDDSSDGVGAWTITPPQPSAFDIYLFAWKDPDVSQDDLIAKASEFQKRGGATEVKVDHIEKVNDYSQIADYTVTEKDGTKRQGDILVFTDVTDNYMLFIEADNDKYQANKDTMDAVWQSFGLYGRDN